MSARRSQLGHPFLSAASAAAIVADAEGLQLLDAVVEVFLEALDTHLQLNYAVMLANRAQPLQDCISDGFADGQITVQRLGLGITECPSKRLPGSLRDQIVIRRLHTERSPAMFYPASPKRRGKFQQPLDGLPKQRT